MILAKVKLLGNDGTRTSSDSHFWHVSAECVVHGKIEKLVLLLGRCHLSICVKGSGIYSDGRSSRKQSFRESSVLFLGRWLSKGN